MRRQLSLLITVAAVALIAGYWASSQFTDSGHATESIPDNLIPVGDTEVVLNSEDGRTPIHHTFLLSNPTPEPITILDVLSGCSCTAVVVLDEREVAPGAVIPLKVSIRSFPAFARSYQQQISVVTNRGELALRIRGSLPTPKEPLWAPTVLYLEPREGESFIERTTRIRVPSECSRDLTTEDIQRSGGEGVSLSLVEDTPSELFREYTLSVVVPVAQLSTARGVLRLETGCGLVTITLKTPQG